MIHSGDKNDKLDSRDSPYLGLLFYPRLFVVLEKNKVEIYYPIHSPNNFSHIKAISLSSVPYDDGREKKFLVF